MGEEWGEGGRGAWVMKTVISTRPYQLRNKNRGKSCNFTILYRSPSQSQDDFERFLKNFELNLDIVLANSPFLTVVLGDFNAKSNLVAKRQNIIRRFRNRGITSQFELQHLLNEPTHLHVRNMSHARNSSSSIDLIFTLQPNLVMESGVHSSLHENCHHQIFHLLTNGKSGIIKKQT